MLEARISSREDEETKLVAERFLSIADAEKIPFCPIMDFGGFAGKASAQKAQSLPERQAAPAPKSTLSGLFIKVPSQNSPEYKKAMQLLAVFDGLTPLYIYFADIKKTVKAPTKMWVDTVSGNNYVAEKLAQLLGSENVKMK